VKDGKNIKKDREMRTKIKCPYCKALNEIPSTEVLQPHIRRRLICCDVEQGGCDKYFVFKAKVNIEITTWKIEENGERNETNNDNQP
jgi:phage FluMu protein Com